MLILPPLSDFISSQITFHRQNAARLYVEFMGLFAQYSVVRLDAFLCRHKSLNHRSFSLISSAKLTLAVAMTVFS